MYNNYCILSQNGYTALHKAAGHGHLDVLEVLINEGCDIDTQDDMVSLSSTFILSKEADRLLKLICGWDGILYHSQKIHCDVADAAQPYF